MTLSQQVEELVDTAKKNKEECESKSWKFTVDNHEIILRDQAANIVACLEQIGDIVVQFAPPQASIPWSAIKAIMKVRRPPNRTCL